MEADSGRVEALSGDHLEKQAGNVAGQRDHRSGYCVDDQSVGEVKRFG